MPLRKSALTSVRTLSAPAWLATPQGQSKDIPNAHINKYLGCAGKRLGVTRVTRVRHLKTPLFSFLREEKGEP